MGSRARASSYGAGPQLLCSMWDLPGSGIEPTSPTLAGGFFPTEPPGTTLCVEPRGQFLSEARCQREEGQWEAVVDF